MSSPVVRVTKSSGGRQLWYALAAALLLAVSAVPVHAQFTYQDLYDFNCQTGGCEPLDSGALIQVGDGSFYGTAGDGGAGNAGTLFDVTTTPVVNYTDFFTFSSPYGATPGGAVAFDFWGNYYATTDQGGAYGNGTLYGNIFGTSMDLHDFTNAEGFPSASPVVGKDWNLYGITSNGAAYTVIATATGATYKSLGTYAPGAVYSPLLLASDGNLYGTSDNGGTDNFGTVFRMTTPSGAIHRIFSFNGKNGQYLYGPLVEPTPLTFYGTTFQGGKNNSGVIFKVTSKGAFTKLFDFAGGCSSTGANPSAGLTLGTDGNLYGVAVNGGANCAGTIFEITTATNSFTKLFDFSGTGGPAPGANPYATLALNSNGILYGLTINGGVNGEGVYFSVAPLNLKPLLTLEGPIFVAPGVRVEIFGNQLTQTSQVTFGGVQAQFQVDSDTLMSATVPMDAVDGVIADTLQTGLQIQTLQAIHILPQILNLDPSSGPVGTQVGITGGGFAGTTKVTFGDKSASFTVVNPSLVQATVPTGARTGYVKITTPNGIAQSPEKFTVN
jgi:uncharacterized repeat protein (TIGR03803 family)